jgi:hypothetical protein
MPPSSQDVPQTIQELQSTQSQVRFWRTLTVIAVILVVVTCVGLISASVNQLTTPTPTQEEFLKELMAGVNEDVVPEVQRIVSLAAADLAPVVQAELNRLNDRSPEFAETLRRELYRLSLNVASRGEQVLDETVGGIIRQRQGWIEKNFENVTPEKAQTMTENLVSIAHDRIEHITDTLFAEHIVALNRITENLSQIQREELANVRHEVPSWEMALLFFDVVRDELRAIETLNTPTGAIDGPIKGDAGEEPEASEEQ